jgi:hypothetical protein
VHNVRVTAKDAPKSADRVVVGPIAEAFAEVVSERRGSGPVSKADALLIVLGDRYAQVADSSTLEDDAGRMIQALEKVWAVVIRLGGEVSRDSGHDAGAELRLVVDGPPSLGNWPDA